MIEVIHPGLLTTIQDGGRKNYEQYGFPHSGFFDPFLASTANRLVGNPLDAPVLEFALLGPTLRFQREAAVAITGYEIDYECDGIVPRNSAIRVKEGSVLRFVATQGWFAYIAISGGIDTQKVLGSAATYSAGNLGVRLQKNMILQFGESNQTIWHLRETNWLPAKDSALQLLSAQHTPEFDASELQKISSQEFQIHSQSNRMGIRLQGSPIMAPNVQRSVPTLPGVLQVPGGGMPIILGPEGPTTGGYPQIGILSRNSWTVLAGNPPGSKLRFEWVEPEKARRLWGQRQSFFLDPRAWQK